MDPDAVVRQQRGVVADRHDEAVRPVLGLGAQVGGGPVGALGEDHAQVARAGEAVDADEPAHLPLGLLDVEVAGADDHVDAPDRLGPVRERGDRLRAAHGVDLVGLAERRGGVDQRVRRRHDDHLVDARGARGHRAHQHRGGIRRPAAGRVHRRAPHGHVAQPHGLALLERHRRVGAQPRRRDRLDVGRRELQRPADVGVEGVERRVEPLLRHPAPLAVAEPRLVRGDRGVPPQAYVLHDRGDHVGDRGGGGDRRADLGGDLRSVGDRAATPHRGSARAARRSRPP